MQIAVVKAPLSRQPIFWGELGEMEIGGICLLWSWLAGQAHAFLVVQVPCICVCLRVCMCAHVQPGWRCKGTAQHCLGQPHVCFLFREMRWPLLCRTMAEIKRRWNRVIQPGVQTQRYFSRLRTMPGIKSSSPLPVLSPSRRLVAAEAALTFLLLSPMRTRLPRRETPTNTLIAWIQSSVW